MIDFCPIDGFKDYFLSQAFDIGMTDRQIRSDVELDFYI